MWKVWWEIGGYYLWSICILFMFFSLCCIITTTRRELLKNNNINNINNFSIIILLIFPSLIRHVLKLNEISQNIRVNALQWQKALIWANFYLLDEKQEVIFEIYSQANTSIQIFRHYFFLASTWHLPSHNFSFALL